MEVVNKKKILIIYPEYFLGGSTTSLVNLLNSFDYGLYDVDLALHKKRGLFDKVLPVQVSIISNLSKFKTEKLFGKIHRILIYLFKLYFFKSIFFSIKYNGKFGFHKQYFSKIAAYESKNIEKNYDVAIGFFEYWSNDYLVQKVNATKKIAWIHTNYKDAGLHPIFDNSTFSEVNNIVSVSQECKQSFDSLFPQFKSKSIVIENIISYAFVKNDMFETPSVILSQKSKLKLVTVSRIDIYTKGLDRIVKAALELKKASASVVWYVIGDGPDKQNFLNLIKKNNLFDIIFFLGEKRNPFIYLSACDLFVLPSRYEGKPMAVTEAQILGVPVMVTKYSSAIEQVSNNKEGIVIKNDDDSLFPAIDYLYKNQYILEELKKNLRTRSFDNSTEIEKLYNLM